MIRKDRERALRALAAIERAVRTLDDTGASKLTPVTARAVDAIERSAREVAREVAR